MIELFAFYVVYVRSDLFSYRPSSNLGRRQAIPNPLKKLKEKSKNLKIKDISMLNSTREETIFYQFLYWKIGSLIAKRHSFSEIPIW